MNDQLRKEIARVMVGAGTADEKFAAIVAAVDCEVTSVIGRALQLGDILEAFKLRIVAEADVEHLAAEGVRLVSQTERRLIRERRHASWAVRAYRRSREWAARLTGEPFSRRNHRALQAEVDRLRRRQAWIDQVGRPDHPDDERPWCAAYLDVREELERVRTMGREVAAAAEVPGEELRVLKLDMSRLPRKPPETIPEDGGVGDF